MEKRDDFFAVHAPILSLITSDAKGCVLRLRKEVPIVEGKVNTIVESVGADRYKR